MSWRIDGRKAAIVVVDVQERLAAAVAGAGAILSKIDRLLEIGRLFSLPVHFTELAPQKLGPISSSLLRSAGDEAGRYARNSLSAGAVLPKELPQYLLIAGMETHAAVRQTVYDLRERGRAVYLLADAVGSRNAVDHEVALEEMRQDRIVVTTVEAAACELGAEAAEPILDQLLPPLS
ncbi:isochorismatase family protein [Methylacidimicrobium tartarophylax]|uniref:Nicotinamidase/pyrazinamidase n=1 Tax=Methylacidimicrobium tartarophylax TaxID=1041768 RepID=A0A5E6M8H1_9BACT|nr:isochorismatase family protein [Methylacidimicrobium tartarophylax]VVM05227.1 nicotinamidase/pyrazinamidase [Methylacidimicrobium tartarophylax]